MFSSLYLVHFLARYCEIVNFCVPQFWCFSLYTMTHEFRSHCTTTLPPSCNKNSENCLNMCGKKTELHQKKFQTNSNIFLSWGLKQNPQSMIWPTKKILFLKVITTEIGYTKMNDFTVLISSIINRNTFIIYRLTSVPHIYPQHLCRNYKKISLQEFWLSNKI